MRARILAIILMTALPAVAVAGADQIEPFLGRFVNPDYGHIKWHGHQVKIVPTPQGANLIFDVPCGTKVREATFAVEDIFSGMAKLKLLDEGSSQCFVGEGARIIVDEKVLEIHLAKLVRFPGFDGVYKFKRVRDVTVTGRSCANPWNGHEGPNYGAAMADADKMAAAACSPFEATRKGDYQLIGELEDCPSGYWGAQATATYQCSR